MEPIILNLLFLAVLFVAAFLNLLFYFPTKRFSFLKLPHFKSSPSSSSSSSAAASPSPVAVNPSPAPADDALKRVFATFDKNSDGFITKKELMESMKSLRMLVTEGEAEEMLDGVDENGDGFIDFEEFCVLGDKFMINRKQVEIEGDGDGDGDEELREAFGVFDKDKDGMISVEELGLVLSSLGFNEGNKLENCKKMINKVDLDGDGMVNFDEFKRMMRSGGGLVFANS